MAYQQIFIDRVLNDWSTWEKGMDEFCRNHGIVKHTLIKWVKRSKRTK